MFNWREVSEKRQWVAGECQKDSEALVPALPGPRKAEDLKCAKYHAINLRSLRRKKASY